MTLQSAFVVTAAIVVGTGTLVKLKAARREPSSFIVPHMVAALAAATGAFALSVPAVYISLDRLTRVPNLAYWSFHALWLYGVYRTRVVALVFTRSANRPTSVSCGRTTCAIAVVAMLALVLASGGSEIPLTLRTLRPTVAAFQLIWASYLLLAFTDLFRMCLHYRPHSRPEIAQALTVVAAGAVSADIYAVVIMAVPLVHIVGLPGFLALQQVGPALLVLAMGLLVFGVVLPSFDRPAHSFRCLRDWRELRPLWKYVHSVQPEIVLHCSGARPWRLPSVADFHFRLYRRVIEIHDGILPLRQYLRASDEAAVRQQAIAAGITDAQLEIIVTAALLRGALTRQQTGHPCRDQPASLECLTTPPGREEDLQSEVSWLRRVARAFIGHPLVPQLARAVLASSGAGPS